MHCCAHRRTALWETAVVMAAGLPVSANVVPPNVDRLGQTRTNIFPVQGYLPRRGRGDHPAQALNSL